MTRPPERRPTGVYRAWRRTRGRVRRHVYAGRRRRYGATAEQSARQKPLPAPLFGPSSQTSGGVTIPLPHAVTVQFASQPSPLTRLPSSHSSVPATTPLPHAVIVQFASQPSPLTRLPSSHCLACQAVERTVTADRQCAIRVARCGGAAGVACLARRDYAVATGGDGAVRVATVAADEIAVVARSAVARRYRSCRPAVGVTTVPADHVAVVALLACEGVAVPSPQTGSVQSASHAADIPPVSHCSPAALLNVPSPQAGSVQFASQVADWPAVSHASPAVTTPLPQAVMVQFASQPSPLTRLWSSHCSFGATTPFPQALTVQLVSQPSPLVALPSSQASPEVALRVPSPHADSLQSILQVAVSPAAVALLARCRVECAVAARRDRAVRVARRRLARRVALLARRAVGGPVAASWQRTVRVARRRLARRVALLTGRRVDGTVAANRVTCSSRRTSPIDPMCRTARRQSTTPLPQAVTVQFASQPSPLIRLPSSHASPRALHAVAASCRRAVRVAAVAVQGVAVVTQLAARRVQRSVAAHRERAVDVARRRLARGIALLAAALRCRCRTMCTCSWRRSRRR